MSQAATVDITSLISQIEGIIEYLRELERGEYEGLAAGDTLKAESLLECAIWALQSACVNMSDNNLVSNDEASEEHNRPKR